MLKWQDVGGVRMISPSSIVPRISDRMVSVLERTRKTVSFILLLKGAAGFAMLALALFGVSVPFLGIEPTNLNGGLAAIAGALLGSVVALRA